MTQPAFFNLINSSGFYFIFLLYPLENCECTKTVEYIHDLDFDKN